MSESWQPEESEIWHTNPSEVSHPSFPIADRGVEPLLQQLSGSNLIPSPPPPPLVVREDEKRTESIIGTTFGMGIGVIIGAFIASVVLVAGIGYLLFNHGFALGNHTDSSISSTLSSTGGGTQGGQGGTGGPGGNGGPGGSGGSGSSGPNVTATNGITSIPAPGTTPINTGTPGASMTATVVAATVTALPPTATSISTPLPMSVTATTQGHQSISIAVQTQAGASLAIKVTFCDGSTQNLTGSAGNGSYSTTLTSGIPKCPGDPPDTLIVMGHLDGYRDTTVTTTTTPVK